MNEIIASKTSHRNVFNNNEGKSVAAERFIRAIKNKIYMYRSSISKECVYW